MYSYKYTVERSVKIMSAYLFVDKRVVINVVQRTEMTTAYTKRNAILSVESKSNDNKAFKIRLFRL